MTAAFHHLDTGTDEQSWSADPRWADVPSFQVEPGRGMRRLVLLAAHPDDETLGAGGLLRRCHDIGLDIVVIVASDGEASHPSSSTHTPAALAGLRRAEVVHAVNLLAPGARIRHLGLPDGELAGAVATIRSAVLEELADLGVGALLVAPWRHDGHPDHDALGAVTAGVARGTGALLLEYPIWWWHRATPDETPWADLRALRLSPEVREAKRRALAAHVTQVQPLSDRPGDEVLLSEGMLAHFDRDVEAFLDTAGASDVPLFERLHSSYDDPWQARDSDFERRKRDLTMLALPLHRFGRAFEPGCSIGEFSARLAERCDELICQDLSDAAVRRARTRLADQPHVRVDVGQVPDDWPEGELDLVALSEVGYFLDDAQLDEVLRLIADRLRPGGYVALCHWSHPIEGWSLDGQQVHDRARRALALPTHRSHVDRDFLLDVLGPRP